MTKQECDDRISDLARRVRDNARIMGPPWTCYLCPDSPHIRTVTVVAYGSGWKLFWSAAGKTRRTCEYVVDTAEQAAKKLVAIEARWAREETSND